ncbi:MAG: hypothetical protein IPL03_13535 [Sterolibacteriaceae bacterium]|nr:hypothetical protein [Candidatus Methylophosphatis haderslevensis]
MRYAWIEANIDSYSVTMMCDLLSVSRSGLHDGAGAGHRHARSRRRRS